jgi:hypothetical protein
MDLLVSSVTIDEDGLTVTFTSGNDNQRRELTSDLQNAENIVITEQQANDVLSVIAERSETIESITADFQAGQVVLNIRGTNNANGIIAILIGLFSPDTGSVKWEIKDLDTVGGTDVSGDHIEMFLTRFSRFIDLQIGGRPVTNFAITADAILISVSGEE